MRRRTVVGITGAATITGFAGCFGEAEHRISSVRVDRAPGPLDLSISVEQPKITVETPARLTVSVTNKTSGTVTIRSSPVWPFGVLGIHQRGDPQWVQTRFDSPAYDDTDRVTMGPNGDGFRMDHSWMTDRLPASATVSEHFLLHRVYGNTSEPYRLVRADGRDEPGIFRYRTEGDDGWTPFTPRVTFEIKRLPPYHFV